MLSMPFLCRETSVSTFSKSSYYSGSKTSASLDRPEPQLPLLLEAATLDLVYFFHPFLGN